MEYRVISGSENNFTIFSTYYFNTPIFQCPMILSLLDKQTPIAINSVPVTLERMTSSLRIKMLKRAVT
jgi:hypothetical protein